MATETIKKIIEAAKKEVGYTEGKNNDNKYAAMVHQANHQPWCATFVNAIFKEAGAWDKILHSASCEQIEAWGKKEGLLIDRQKAKAGDLILFDFSDSGKAQHIGIAVAKYDLKTQSIKTIEGNTGAQSQTNGEGVYKKTRQIGFIRSVIRPKY